jgi:antitoxin VapB
LVDIFGGRDMSATAKLFTHGRSQAVRLPKEFRFEGKAVRVSRVGRRVILEPLDSEDAMPWAEIDALSDQSFMPDGREQPPMSDDRPVFD